ncbi:MAG: putative nickel-responsive regulator [Anaerolineales bacterium]|nr:putative nickel-responsive regulator [Anaerolineales bacterium]
MKTITVRLDDNLAGQVERVQREGRYASKSEVLREALRLLLVEERKQQLRENLQWYLEDKEALQEAADAVEDRMVVTEEALEHVDG